LQKAAENVTSSLMRHYRKAAAPLLLFFAFGGATPAHAGVRVVEPWVDLGEVRAGVRLTRVFDVANDGPESAEIVAVNGSCGCLKPMVEPALIPARGTAKLTMSINTLGQGAGVHSWSARVRYRVKGMEDKERELAAAVSARIITEVTVQPAALTIAATGSLTQLVTLTDLRATSLAITAVDTSTAGLQARLLRQGRDPEGRWIGRIQLDVTAALAPGRHSAALSIYTDDPVYRRLEVPVTIIKESARSITAIPEAVVLGPAAGESASALVRLHSLNDRAVRISKIETGHPALTFTWAAGPGSDVTLRLHFDPARWTGGDTGATAQIHLDSPMREVLPLPVRVQHP
jgi:hypothetical protein